MGEACRLQCRRQSVILRRQFFQSLNCLAVGHRKGHTPVAILEQDEVDEEQVDDEMDLEESEAVPALDDEESATFGRLSWQDVRESVSNTYERRTVHKHGASMSSSSPTSSPGAPLRPSLIRS